MRLLHSRPGETLRHAFARRTAQFGLIFGMCLAVNLTALATTTSLVAPGSVWRYLDNGSNQNTAWRAPGFVDGAWLTGSAQFGYGDGDEVTVVSYGSDSFNKHITTYFRRTFSCSDPAMFTALVIRLLRDDGAVVYLNGTEVARSNLPTGTVDYLTTAPSAVEDNTFHQFQADPAPVSYTHLTLPTNREV